MLIALIVFSFLVLGIWLFFGANLSVFFGPHRQRHSNIESWEKTETIATRLGDIVGLQQSTASGRVMAFLGIRYGKAPEGELRFMPPQAAEPWGERGEVLQASTFPNAAIQSKADASTQEPNAEKTSEDCLFLSVYTPSVEGASRPVMVWIHGGAFLFGTGNGYPSHQLAEQGDVVVVAINYRLGLLGFCDLSKYGEAYQGTASNGIRDQILALQWVRDNIADYGGDPKNVTIFGESAGAASVSCLLAAPAAHGLYHKAVIHSGMAVSHEPPDYSEAICKALKLSDGADIPAALKAVPAEDIPALQKKIGMFGGAHVDGSVIEQPLKDVIASKRLQDVPVIIGSNKDEGTLFSMVVPRIFYAAFEPGLAGMITEEESSKAYVDRLKKDYPGDSKQQRYERVWTESFRSSAVLSAEWAAAAGMQVWLYRFDEAVQISPFGHRLGASHAAEMEFTFNNFARNDMGDKAFWYRKDDADILALARDWSNSLLQFARSGSPNGAGLPNWSTYTNDSKACLILKKQPEMAANIDAVELQRWSEFRQDGDELQLI